MHILFECLLIVFQVVILYFQPSVFRCILLRWVRLLGFATVYGTVTLKLYRYLQNLQCCYYFGHILNNELSWLIKIWIIAMGRIRYWEWHTICEQRKTHCNLWKFWDWCLWEIDMLLQTNNHTHTHVYTCTYTHTMLDDSRNIMLLNVTTCTFLIWPMRWNLLRSLPFQNQHWKKTMRWMSVR